MTIKVRELLRDLRQRFELLYEKRLCEIILYGSHCRSEASPQSDIDVLVVLSGKVNAADEISRTIFDVSELSLENDVVISCLFMSQEEYDKEQSLLLTNIRREGQSI